MAAGAAWSCLCQAWARAPFTPPCLPTPAPCLLHSSHMCPQVRSITPLGDRPVYLPSCSKARSPTVTLQPLQVTSAGRRGWPWDRRRRSPYEFRSFLVSWLCQTISWGQSKFRKYTVISIHLSAEVTRQQEESRGGYCAGKKGRGMFCSSSDYCSSPPLSSGCLGAQPRTGGEVCAIRKQLQTARPAHPTQVVTAEAVGPVRTRRRCSEHPSHFRRRR